MAGTPGATARATGKAPLRGAGTGGGGPPPAVRLPHTQPAGSARPGAAQYALGGECPPPFVQRAPRRSGWGGTGGEHMWIGEGRGTSNAPRSTSAPLPLLPPPRALTLQEDAEVEPARGTGTGTPVPAGHAPRTPSSNDPPPRPRHYRHSGRGRGRWGNGAPCSPCAMRIGPPHASRAGGTGGCGIAALGTTRGTLGRCQRRVVRDSAHSSGWEACAPPSRQRR